MTIEEYMLRREVLDEAVAERDVKKREQKLADEARQTLADEISASGSRIDRDAVGRVSFKGTPWVPGEEAGSFTRPRTDADPDVNPWYKFADRGPDIETSLAIEMNRVLTSSLLADKDISEVDYKKIKDAADKANVSTGTLVDLWDPALQKMWRDLEKSDIINQMGQ